MNWLRIVLVSLAVILVFAVAGLALLANEAASKRQLLETQEAQLNAAIEERDSIHNQLSDAESVIEEKLLEISSLNEDIDSANDAANRAGERYDRLLDTTLERSAEIWELRSDLFRAEDLLDCPYPIPEFDYTGNSSVSGGLGEFVGDVGGSALAATWEVLWTRNRAALHEVMVRDSNPYGFVVYKFISYFEDDPWLEGNYVFWVNAGCWLDRPSED